MEEFSTIITLAGDAKVVEALGGTTLTLAEFAVGDGAGEYHDPDEDQTELVNEMWRGPLASISVDPSDDTRRIVSAYIPANVGGWWIREAGLYTDDGVLFAVAKIPAREKADPVSGSAVGVYIKMYLEVNTSKIEVVVGVERLSPTELYNPALAYVPNVTVSYLGNVYVSILNAAAGENPLSYTNKWQVISQRGAAGTIAVGTVTTGAAGSSVVVTNSGTPEDAVLDITIPKGDTAGEGIGFSTKALMNADLAHNAGTLARVTNDATPSNNGIYLKSGASGVGSWTQSSFDRVTRVENRQKEVMAAFPLDTIQAQSYVSLQARTAVSASIFGWAAAMTYSVPFDTIRVKVLTDAANVNLRVKILKLDFTTEIISCDYLTGSAGNYWYVIPLPFLVDSSVITESAFYVSVEDSEHLHPVYHDVQMSRSASIQPQASYPHKYRQAGAWAPATVNATDYIYIPVFELYKAISGPLARQAETDALEGRATALEGRATTLEAAEAALADTATGRLNGLYYDGITFQHSRGETEMTGIGNVYQNATIGQYKLCSKAVTFNTIEFYAYGNSSVTVPELRIYEVSWNPATKAAPFTLVGETLKATVALDGTVLFGAALVLRKVALPSDITISAGKYLVLALIATNSSSIYMGRQNEDYADRTPIIYSTARDGSGMNRGSASYSQCAFRLKLESAAEKRVTVLETNSLQVNANNEIRRGFMPYVQFTPPQGASEVDGNSTYTTYVLGFCIPITSQVTVNALLTRMWAANPSTIEWRAWIRPNATVFNTTTITPADSGTIAGANFPTTNSGQYTLRLNKGLTLNSGQYLVVLFLASNGSTVSIPRWTYNAGISRSGFLFHLTGGGWPTTFSGSDYTSGYGQATPMLLLESEELRAKGGANNALTTTYSNATSGLLAATVQAAIDEITLRLGGPPRLVLPDEVVAVVGDNLQLFLRGIVEAQNPYNMPVTLDCSVGKNTPRYFTVTPAVGDVGTKVLTAQVLNPACSVLGTKAMNVIVVNPTGQPASNKNVICVGDSLTGGGQWASEFQRRVCGSGGLPAGLGYGNTTFLGNFGSGAQKWVGYGGWTMDSYLGTGAMGAWVTVASHDKTTADQHSYWLDSLGQKWSLETIQAGQLKLTGYGGASYTMPAGPNTLTWSSGGTHTATISYSATTAEAGTPFWNSGTGQFSIKAFCDNNGYGDIDIMYLLLGWNSIPSANAYDASFYTTYLTKFRTFLDKFKLEYPSGKMRIMGIQVPSINGGLGANYGATGANAHYYKLLRSVNGMNIAYQALCNEAAYSGFTKFLSVAPQFDSENNMPQADTAVNARHTTTEKVGTNGVHPDTQGYNQIADVAFRDYIRSFCS